MDMVKKRLIYLLCILISTNIGAQNRGLLAQADKKFEHLMFLDAANLYEKAISRKQTDEVKKKIALCYVKMNDPLKVTQWYGKLVSKTTMGSEHHYNYAQALTSIGKFTEAKQYYQIYEKEASKDQRAKNKIYALNHLEDYYKDSSKYDVERLDVLNSVFSDFAPSFYKDGIVFPSGRVLKNGTKRTFKWDNSSFLDLYYSEKNGLSEFDYKDPISFNSTINTKYHEGASTFSSNGDKIIFTRNNYFHNHKKKSNGGSILLKLYFAEHTEGQDSKAGWHHISELPFNSNEYSVGDPSANNDFTILYFVSNMPGGIGGTDVYKSVYTNGKWAQPENLGASINTEGNERMPFIHEDGTLFFSSDGKDGIGGLDVYEAKFIKNKWIVKDMGYPINSTMDDFGLILDETKKFGYFSSNRYGGLGSDDIYKFLVKDNSIMIKGKTFVKLQGALDITKKTLSSAEVTIFDKTNNVFLTPLESNESGEFSLKLNKESVYEIKSLKTDLTTAITTLDLRSFDESKEATSLELILIEPLPNMIKLNAQVRDKDSKEIMPNSIVYLMDIKTKEISTYKTDSQGEIAAFLKPQTEYVMKATKIKFLSDCISFNSGVATKAGKEPERPLLLESFKVSQKFKIENVYFDLNKDNIRPDAAIELDKVVAFIKDNPGITVELGSHTDARGSDVYNLALSDRRAKSSRQYIVNNGISNEMITHKGYGELEVTNRCLNDVKCTDKEHEANRRTEIKITGIKDLSLEEQALLEKNKAGFTEDDNLNNCEQVILKSK